MRSPWIFQAGPTFNDKCPSQRWKRGETQTQGRGHVETEAEAGKTRHKQEHAASTVSRRGGAGSSPGVPRSRDFRPLDGERAGFPCFRSPRLSYFVTAYLPSCCQPPSWPSCPHRPLPRARWSSRALLLPASPPDRERPDPGLPRVLTVVTVALCKYWRRRGTEEVTASDLCFRWRTLRSPSRGAIPSVPGNGHSPGAATTCMASYHGRCGGRRTMTSSSIY